ncbi:MAG: hypothetical protein Q8P72_00350 [Candidatus Roizmanbacteria bacterium]|nr:hypothetical protein [Candidatus Roizmanbacteria bacterium]
MNSYYFDEYLQFLQDNGIEIPAGATLQVIGLFNETGFNMRAHADVIDQNGITHRIIRTLDFDAGDPKSYIGPRISASIESWQVDPSASIPVGHTKTAETYILTKDQLQIVRESDHDGDDIGNYTLSVDPVREIILYPDRDTVWRISQKFGANADTVFLGTYASVLKTLWGNVRISDPENKDSGFVREGVIYQ